MARILVVDESIATRQPGEQVVIRNSYRNEDTIVIETEDTRVLHYHDAKLTLRFDVSGTPINLASLYPSINYLSVMVINIPRIALILLPSEDDLVIGDDNAPLDGNNDAYDDSGGHCVGGVSPEIRIEGVR